MYRTVKVAENVYTAFREEKQQSVDVDNESVK